MKLTQEQKETILYKLGYNHDSAYNAYTDLDRDYWTITVNRMDAIVNELDSVDMLLVEARTDSMAVKADTTELDFVQHITHLEREGSKLLRELGSLVGVEIQFNKYSGRSSHTGKSSSGSTYYSYW